MLAICIEASHARGMGHLFRALSLITCLEERKKPYIILINEDIASQQILEERKLPYEIINFKDETGNWESDIIRKYHVTMWLNDKFESSYALCTHVKENGIPLAVIDDRGEGARLADIHFAGMLFDRKISEIPGKRIFAGLKYNILNTEINRYKRIRRKLNRIVVTLGGSDTYGATVLAVKALKKYGYPADVIVGANFRHEKELGREIDENYQVYHTVPSLMKAFFEYDLAITGGGVTPLEANAAGLPCIIIANEPHEVITGNYMQQLGGAVFAGYYKELDDGKFELSRLNIEQMSRRAIQSVSLSGADNICNILLDQ